MKQAKYKIIVILGVLGVSLSAIFVKYATAPSMVLACYRMSFAAILLAPVVFCKYRDELKKLPIKEALFCCLSGIFLACHFTAYFESIRFTSVASSTVLVDTEVLFVAIITIFIFRESISKYGLIGIALAFIGSVVLAMVDSGSGSDVLYGDFLAIAGAVFVTVYTLIGRRQRKKMTTTLYTFLVYASAAVTLLVFCAVTKTSVIATDPMNYLWGFLLTICCTLLGHSVFSWGLKYIPAAFISTAKLGEPLFATILSIFLFGEIPGVLQVVGGLIILSGLYLYTVKD